MYKYSNIIKKMNFAKRCSENILNFCYKLQEYTKEEKIMKKILATLCSLVMVASLVACGSSASSSSSEVASVDSTVAASTTTATNTGSGRSLEDIKKAGVLKVLTNAEFPPYEYLGSGGVVSGVDIDLCQQIADEIGVELEIVNMDFDSLIIAMQAGQGDIVASGMSITDERKEQVDFTIPYVDTTLYVVVKEGDTSITSVDDITGKKVAVQEGTTSDLIVSDMDVKEVLRYKTSADAVAALKNGSADLVVMDDLTATNVSEALGGLTILKDIEVSHEQYAMAVPKGSADFLVVVDSVLQKAVDADQVNTLIAQHMEAAKA